MDALIEECSRKLLPSIWYALDSFFGGTAQPPIGEDARPFFCQVRARCLILGRSLALEQLGVHEIYPESPSPMENG